MKEKYGKQATDELGMPIKFLMFVNMSEEFPQLVRGGAYHKVEHGTVMLADKRVKFDHSIEQFGEELARQAHQTGSRVVEHIIKNYVANLPKSNRR
ncbi:MAG: hypothetical protein V1811_01170 [Candidatus Micrarchaeota archaeon]